MTVLVLLGHAGRAVQHKPEVCYPAVGYAPDDDALDVTVDTGSTPARFRSLVFKREGATGTVRQEVFYAFRHGGVWAPDVSGNWRDQLHDPAFYKVQVQRAVTKTERRTSNNPTEQFLAAFIPALEERIRGARSRDEVMTGRTGAGPVNYRGRCWAAWSARRSSRPAIDHRGFPGTRSTPDTPRG